MQPPTIDALAGRVDQLERENRRLKRVGAAAAAVLGVGLLMGQATAKPKVVQAHRVVVLDEAGNERIVLGAAKDHASIQLKTEDGKATSVIAVAKESAGVSVTDENGRHRVTLGKDLRPGGGAGLWLYDEQGNLRYSVGVDRRGPGVAVLDETGKRVP